MIARSRQAVRSRVLWSGLAGAFSRQAPRCAARAGVHGAVGGEQSGGEVRWKALGTIPPVDRADNELVLTVPGKSVTSLCGNY